jgi:dTDP-4-dehydrorhamnose 3,5-epimerase
MIEGVLQTPLTQHQDQRGKVMHMLRSTDPYFQKFGEVYFSWVYPNFIKAWYKHREMIVNFAVPIGAIKVVIYDDRCDSPTHNQVGEYNLGCDNYHLLTIPCGLWYGFRAISEDAAIMANCATIPHDPEEITRLDFANPSIPYNWNSSNVS